MTILRRHSSAHRRRSSSNLLQSQAPVTASPVRRRCTFLVFQNVTMIRMSMMMMMMMRTLMMIKFYQLGGSVPNSLGRCSPLSRYFKLQTHHHQCLSPSSSSMILFNHHDDHSFHYSRRNSSIRDLNPAPSPFPGRPEVSTTSEFFLRGKLL